MAGFIPYVIRAKISNSASIWPWNSGYHHPGAYILIISHFICDKRGRNTYSTFLGSCTPKFGAHSLQIYGLIILTMVQSSMLLLQGRSFCFWPTHGRMRDKDDELGRLLFCQFSSFRNSDPTPRQHKALPIYVSMKLSNGLCSYILSICAMVANLPIPAAILSKFKDLYHPRDMLSIWFCGNN